MEENSKCDIIIPVWNMRKLTEQCVNSIIRHTKFPYRLIIVDNASENETRQYLEDLKRRKDINVALIKNEENLGFAKAVNQGIRASDREYVCILGNDTIVMDNWLTEMIEVAEKDKKIGVVNPLSNHGSKKPIGKSWEDIARQIYEKNKGDYIETASATGFCLLIKREVIEKVGLLSEIYGLGYFEDTEYCIRVIRSGYKIAIAQGAYVVHLEHASFKKIEDFGRLFKRNQKLFYNEFGRSKRLLYILTGKGAFGLDQMAYETVQNRNWIWVFLQKGVNIELPRHAYIKLFHLHRLFFQLNCFLRVIKRKKKFDVIYSDSPSLNRKLEFMKELHKAEVVRLNSE